jgi:hypothetical protein
MSEISERAKVSHNGYEVVESSRLTEAEKAKRTRMILLQIEHFFARALETENPDYHQN